ncbi:helix-turn-helix domain-containing protein [Pseudalkalibacillus hwajinpoensis]|uniref:helix-turn-helix domain-containing protein n=1 Tax=Guptibacillus hwajinpoensis TaxID=208199 RepID=UPI002AC36857|nr:helix-turn-helix domain-containing protein [Pseudalkalibacillus hwajinpoensis]
MYMEIQQLIKQGFSKSKVAIKLGVSRSTVYRHLKKSPSECLWKFSPYVFFHKKIPVEGKFQLVFSKLRGWI